MLLLVLFLLILAILKQRQACCPLKKHLCCLLLETPSSQACDFLSALAPICREESTGVELSAGKRTSNPLNLQEGGELNRFYRPLFASESVSDWQERLNTVLIKDVTKYGRAVLLASIVRNLTLNEQTNRNIFVSSSCLSKAERDRAISAVYFPKWQLISQLGGFNFF